MSLSVSFMEIVDELAELGDTQGLVSRSIERFFGKMSTSSTTGIFIL